MTITVNTMVYYISFYLLYNEYSLHLYNYITITDKIDTTVFLKQTTLKCFKKKWKLEILRWFWVSLVCPILNTIA